MNHYKMEIIIVSDEDFLERLSTFLVAILEILKLCGLEVNGIVYKQD